MTRVIITETGKRIVLLAPEKPQQCDLCGKIDELRPYGPNGACICPDCAKKDWDATKKRMEQYLFGDEE